MRRRMPPVQDDSVPAEIVSYQAWCERRGLTPYPAVPVRNGGLAPYLRQQQHWEADRETFMARHGFAELVEEELPADFWNPQTL
jgi:hypothetical protein